MQLQPPLSLGDRKTSLTKVFEELRNGDFHKHPSTTGPPGLSSATAVVGGPLTFFLD